MPAGITRKTVKTGRGEEQTEEIYNPKQIEVITPPGLSSPRSISKNQGPNDERPTIQLPIKPAKYLKELHGIKTPPPPNLESIEDWQKTVRFIREANLPLVGGLQPGLTYEIYITSTPDNHQVAVVELLRRDKHTGDWKEKDIFAIVNPSFIITNPYALRLLQEELQKLGQKEHNADSLYYYELLKGMGLGPNRAFNDFLDDALRFIRSTLEQNIEQGTVLTPTYIIENATELLEYDYKTQHPDLALSPELIKYFIVLALLSADAIEKITAGQEPNLQIQDIWPDYQNLKEQIKGELISLGLASLQSNAGEDNKSETANT